MWMSELSSRSGLPVPTIKYYLRERLLHPGEAVGATRARYDDSHVRRLRLVRALIDVAGMRLDDVRRVLTAIDDPDLSLPRGDRQRAHPAGATGRTTAGGRGTAVASTPCLNGTAGSSTSAVRTATPSPAHSRR